MTVLIAGSSGLIGTALASQLEREGTTVQRLVRRPAERANEVQWTPGTPLDPGVLDGVAAVINLAGASIGQIPWTAKRREAILRSRVDSTRTLVDALRSNPGAALINGSAVGFYGDRDDEALTEDAGRGTGFLADVVAAWEAEAMRASDITRVVLARTGLVVANGGGIAPLRMLTALGVGGPLGSGRQWWPWISLHDEVRALSWLAGSNLSGAVNLAGPQPATMADLGRALARELHRPFWLPAPAFALRTLLGDAGQELLLSSQKLVPARLTTAGFTFEHATVGEAVRAITAR